MQVITLFLMLQKFTLLLVLQKFHSLNETCTCFPIRVFQMLRVRQATAHAFDAHVSNAHASD